MTANVRCAGGLQANQRGWPTGNQVQPCGWKGERFASGWVSHEEADTLTIDQLATRIRELDTKLRTTKPCPRCGGRVELIVEDQGSGGVW